ncbi:phage tail tip fiber protein [Agrobacterium larrymoorei]|uniref:phage tail tip fiber protein n=1 Tax=Agrobacterium larrymoorei TaxID=160699 RepID=UPI0030BCC3E3
MAFISSIIGAIGAGIAAIGTWAAANTVLAGILTSAFSIAAQYAVSKLFPPKTPSSSAQIETEYGANNPRTVILGTCGLAGRHVYRNNFSDGGRIFVDVYELASFRITDVPRVKYNGQWRTLSNPTPGGWYDVPNEGTSGDSRDEIQVKFYYGSMDQQADPYLIETSRPAGRWTEDHRGVGVAYAVVYSVLSRKGRGLTSPAQLLFEVKGAPLYDWRKDSSVGGAGPHRWNDQSTWEYSDNPAVQAYNLERGFFHGAQRMVGKGVRASRLPLSEWTQAANICDEIVDGYYRYRSHMIAKDGPGANHDANLQPLLEAMCASWVERVDGEFPIGGAPQAIVATITDDDIKVGAPKRFTAKRKRTELINTVAASYISPDDFYETKDAATRIDQSALAEDRETLASSIPYGAVTNVKQVDRLADIALRGARFQASAEITIHPRFLDVVKEGRWITWASAKHGTRTYQVLSRTLGPHSSDGVRDITVSLQEISNGVFDPTAYATNPPVIIVVPPPEYLAEVQNFTATPNVVEAEGGGLLPGVRLSWGAIQDISVTGVLIEYWPVANPTQVFTKMVDADISVVQIVEGLTSETDLRVRTTLVVDNGRAVAPSGITNFRTLQAGGDFVADLQHLGKDAKAVFTQLGGEIDDLWKRLEESTTAFTLDGAIGQIDRQKMRAELGAARAQIVEEKRVRVSESEALAETLTALSASFGENFAEGLVSFKAVASPEDVLVRFAIMLRAGTDEDFTESGFYIQIRTVGGVRVSEVGFLADKFTILTEDGALPVFATEGGVVKIINAMIEQAQIENLFVGQDQIEPASAGFIKSLQIPGNNGGNYDFVVRHGVSQPGTHHEIRLDFKLQISRLGTGSTGPVTAIIRNMSTGEAVLLVNFGVIFAGQTLNRTEFTYVSLAESQTQTQTVFRVELQPLGASLSYDSGTIGAILTKNVPNNI